MPTALSLSIGFTGTRNGMTIPQFDTVNDLLDKLWSMGFRNAHHGVCVGADCDFHTLAVTYSYRTIGHPGVNDWGKPWMRADVVCDEMLPEKRFHERNTDIVRESDAMIATPKEYDEQLTGGTWSTVRKARTAGKPCVIVWPDGSAMGDITT